MMEEEHIVKQTFMKNPVEERMGILISTVDMQSLIKAVPKELLEYKYETMAFEVDDEGMNSLDIQYRCDKMIKALENHMSIIKSYVEQGYKVKDMA